MKINISDFNKHEIKDISGKTIRIKSIHTPNQLISDSLLEVIVEMGLDNTSRFILPYKGEDDSYRELKNRKVKVPEGYKCFLQVSKDPTSKVNMNVEYEIIG